MVVYKVSFICDYYVLLTVTLLGFSYWRREAGKNPNK